VPDPSRIGHPAFVDLTEFDPLVELPFPLSFDPAVLLEP
jgi:hypothetical protein